MKTRIGIFEKLAVLSIAITGGVFVWGVAFPSIQPGSWLPKQEAKAQPTLTTQSTSQPFLTARELMEAKTTQEAIDRRATKRVDSSSISNFDVEVKNFYKQGYSYAWVVFQVSSTASESKTIWVACTMTDKTGNVVNHDETTVVSKPGKTVDKMIVDLLPGTKNVSCEVSRLAGID